MFKVTVKTSGLSPDEQNKIDLAAQRMELVFNSEEFKNFVLNFSYPVTYCSGRLWWKKCTTETRSCFVDNQGLTNFQIYNRLMSGAETLDQTPDSEADIFVEVDRRNRRGVIGYTYPSTKWQWIYQWVLLRYSIFDIASNLAHEWCHKIGFDHSYKWTATREYSVPYAIGNFVSKAQCQKRKFVH